MTYQGSVVTLVLSAVLGGVAPARAAAQGAPVIERMHVDDSFVTGFCGYPMEVRQAGTGIFHLWFDESGALQRAVINSGGIHISFTNLLTGETVWTPSVNIVLLDIDSDGAVESYRGLLWRLVVPHAGLITADTGRIDYSYTFDDNGEPVFEGVTFVAGQQENQFIPSVCAALAS